MKRSIRILVVLGLLMAFVMVFTACGSQNGPAPSAGGNQTTTASGQKVVELTMWQQWGNGHEKEVLDSIIKDFEKENPNIKINEIAFKAEDNPKILTSIAGGNPPDILDLQTTAVIGEWAAKGALTPLNEYIDRDKVDKNKFIPASWNSVTYKDQIYAMPFVAFNEGLLWNKKMFREAGLDPEKPPKTFDEMIEFNKRLTKVDADGKITQMGFIPNWPVSHLYSSLGWQTGAGFFNAAENKTTVNEPAIVQALQWERKFYNGYNPQKVQNFVSSSGEYLTAQDLFESGKLAICIDGSWVIRFIQENIPELAPDIGAAYIPTPANHPERYGTSFIDVNPQIIPKGAKHPDEAWKFIKWETTDPDLASKFADLVANVPQIIGAPTTELLKDARFKVFIDLASSEKAKVFPVLPISNEYITKITDLENRILLDPKLNIKGELDKLNDELNTSLTQSSK